jgi:mannose-6-phosphate isomerase-like protein (cupin superfamily)
MNSIVPNIQAPAAERQLRALLPDHRTAKALNAVERSWGSFEPVIAGRGYLVKRIVVRPGRKLSLQYHQFRSEHWTVVEGEAHATVGEDVMILQPDDSIYIPLGAVHRLENRGRTDVVVIEVQCGAYLGEDDIVRIDDDFGRT